jgi:hypothetical protein
MCFQCALSLSPGKKHRGEEGEERLIPLAVGAEIVDAIVVVMVAVVLEIFTMSTTPLKANNNKKKKKELTPSIKFRPVTFHSRRRFNLSSF